VYVNDVAAGGYRSATELLELLYYVCPISTFVQMTDRLHTSGNLM